jgi:hypothetical protein
MSAHTTTIATLSPDWDGNLRVVYVEVDTDRAAAFSQEIARALS